MSGPSQPVGELTVTATCRRTIGQDFATPTTGSKVQPPLADGRSKVLILRSGRSSAGGACRHRARAVRLHLDQPNRCCRPQAARQISPKLPDAQPRLLAFRIHERALGDLRQPASCCRSAPPHGRQFVADKLTFKPALDHSGPPHRKGVVKPAPSFRRLDFWQPHLNGVVNL